VFGNLDYFKLIVCPERRTTCMPAPEADDSSSVYHIKAKGNSSNIFFRFLNEIWSHMTTKPKSHGNT
jgi:hypothetical protein